MLWISDSHGVLSAIFGGISLFKINGLQSCMMDLQTLFLPISTNARWPVHHALSILERWLHGVQIHVAQPLNCVWFYFCNIFLANYRLYGALGLSQEFLDLLEPFSFKVVVRWGRAHGFVHRYRHGRLWDDVLLSVGSRHVWSEELLVAWHLGHDLPSAHELWIVDLDLARSFSKILKISLQMQWHSVAPDTLGRWLLNRHTAPAPLESTRGQELRSLLD
jgi:hypothetical protein